MEYYPWSEDAQDVSRGLETQPYTGIAMAQRGGGQLIVRSPQAPPMDLGAQVAARRNLEFSAGQRSHRISMGSYTRA